MKEFWHANTPLLPGDQMPHALASIVAEKTPMLAVPRIQPALVYEYTDPDEGFKGWLVRDSKMHRLCAGGMRVQQGLELKDLISMAHNMSLKMRIHNLHVDGAKCGIDYPPDGPHKKAAMRRFIKALSPLLQTCYSMGPDLNTEMDELEALAQELAMPSVKMAIAATQGWDLAYFIKRTAILDQEVQGWPLGRLRAGFGVAAAAFAVLDFLSIPIKNATFCIQGFGALARATAFSIVKNGGKILAIADAQKCITSLDGHGLDIHKLLTSNGRLLPETISDKAVVTGPPDSLWQVPSTILIPAAVEHAINYAVTEKLVCRAIVPGANLAVSNAAEAALDARGVLVLPDFIPGSGGSLSMEGLYGPPSHPPPEQVLTHIDNKMRQAVTRVLVASQSQHITPRDAALDICTNYRAPSDVKPYDIS
jgi:glutamate dehydrogenase (NAD(P)+)